MEQRPPIKRYTFVETKVSDTIKIAHAISIGIYLISAVIVTSIIGGVVLQLAFPGPTMQSPVPDSTNSVSLSWTAPGDDGNVGTAASYEIRYATDVITDASWPLAQTFVAPPTPLPAGTAQSAVVTGLNPGTQYYVAMKSTDEAGNESPLSNVASKKTDVVSCIPEWSCTEWTACRDETQTRSCVDARTPSCGTDFNRPIERQTCSTPEPAQKTCTEQWSCTEWTACTDGQQTRSCLDLERCGTEKEKPQTTYDCSSGGPLPDNPNPTYLTATPAKGGPGVVKLFQSTTGRKKGEFYVYDRKYRSGLSVGGGDVDQDGSPDIVTGTGAGKAPQVSVFSSSGKLATRFSVYSTRFRTGLNVAVADVDGDGKDDIITAPATGFSSLVRVYRYDPTRKKYSRYLEFTALSSRFRGGANIAAADLDRDGLAEVIVAPAAKGRKSTLEVYEYDLNSGRVVLQHSFSAYEKSFNGGIEVAAADVDGDGNEDIVTVPAPGATDVRAYTYSNRRTKLLGRFFAGSKTFRGGAVLTSLDVDLDGKDEVITGTFSKGLPGVRVFTRNPLTRKFERISSPFPPYVFSASFLKGIRIGTL